MFKADDLAVLPVASWIQQGVQWAALHLRPTFLAIKWPIEKLLTFNDGVLHAIPFPVMVLLTFVFAWRLTSLGVAAFSAAGLVAIAVLGVWGDAMTTLSLIATAIVFCAVLGIPIGICCARSSGSGAWCARSSTSCRRRRPSFISCLL